MRRRGPEAVGRRQFNGALEHRLSTPRSTAASTASSTCLPAGASRSGSPRPRSRSSAGTGAWRPTSGTAGGRIHDRSGPSARGALRPPQMDPVVSRPVGAEDGTGHRCLRREAPREPAPPGTRLTQLPRPHAARPRQPRRASGGRLPPRAGHRCGQLQVREHHPSHRPRPGRRECATLAVPARRSRAGPQTGLLRQLPRRKGIVTNMLRQPTLDLLHELRLTGMAQTFEEQLAMPRTSANSPSTTARPCSSNARRRNGNNAATSLPPSRLDPGRTDRTRHRRTRIWKVLSGMRTRPPGLPARYLDPLPPHLPAPRPTRVGPRPRLISPSSPRRLART